MNTDTTNDTENASGKGVASSGMLGNFPKWERDGKIAVIYSPGYGAGWSTWNTEEWGPLMSMHRDLCKLVDEGKQEEAGTLAESLIRSAADDPDKYVAVLGCDDLRLVWMSKGTAFRVIEYDGSESIEYMGEVDYLIA